MSVYARYEYDKMFKSTTKKLWSLNHDLINQWLYFSFNYREPVSNGCKDKHFLAFVKPNIPPDRKNSKAFNHTDD